MSALDRARAFERAGDHESARRELEAELSRAAESLDRTEVALELAYIEDALGAHARADELRRSVLAEHDPTDLSRQALIARVEAIVGLGQAEQAAPLAQAAAKLPQEPGEELERTVRRIADVARLRGEDRHGEAAARIEELVGPEHAAAAEEAFIGKIGLALSGGGFRASLFHIGVLARLAELDTLRRVDVLSCVSGGSIVGAYYYLKVRTLIESKHDRQPSRDDYVKLVQELEDDFLRAIASNIRMRLFTNPLRVMQMAVDRKYTRTERAAALYQQKLYTALGNDDWRLPDLCVQPPDEPEGFNPQRENWHRTAKVPILVLNATTLNTGHNWQFTATWMGEPPDAIDDTVDSADRLRRVYHRDAPPDHRRTKLGRAVAASAAVPGLFPPIKLAKLYPDVLVDLSDGGVYDNQGIESLVEQECSVILVSDASGQGKSIVEPQDSAPLVLGRTLNVTMARIRDAQFIDLANRRAAATLHGLMFVHLKDDLPRADIAWIGAKDGPAEQPGENDTGRTVYGICRDVQRRLASIRTDLDSFHEYEAFSLMASGYRMVEHYFPQGTVGFPPAARREKWRFCSIQHAVEGDAGHATLLEKIAHSDRLFFKWFPWPGLMTKIVLGLVVALLAAAVWAAAAACGATGVVILLAVLLVVVVLAAVPDGSNVVYAVSLLAKVPLGIAGAIVGPLISWPYLWTLNGYYLRQGRVPSAEPVVWIEDKVDKAVS